MSLKVKFRGGPATRADDCQGPLSAAADSRNPRVIVRTQSSAEVTQRCAGNREMLANGQFVYKVGDAVINVGFKDASQFR